MKAGGPAFPREDYQANGYEIGFEKLGQEGMSLLDYMAAKAMASVPLALDRNEQQLIANAAYSQARAMLKAREGE